MYNPISCKQVQVKVGLTGTMDAVCPLLLRTEADGGPQTDDGRLVRLFASFGDSGINSR